MRAPHIIDETSILNFQRIVLKWYFIYGRTFLWREKSATNYQVIISEIFLQRTKAEKVASYLPIFFSKYSSWKQLAICDKDELRETIKPLGLQNQRSERIFRLAREFELRNGQIPEDRQVLMELPMIGHYLTNALELYILNKKRPLLDVNMARILNRYFGQSTYSDIRFDPYLQTLAYRIVNIDQSKELNWGILDYASLICKKSPLCVICLLSEHCSFLKAKFIDDK